MPNHCMNRLSVTGPICDVEQFKKAVGDDKEPLSCETIMPMPFELRCYTAPNKSREEEFTKKYGSKDWWHWCVNNWGTKWGVYDNSGWETPADEIRAIHSKGKSAVTTDSMTFTSAWSPPIPVIQEASKYFPTLQLTLEYCEPGACFAGRFVTCGGDGEDECFEDDSCSDYIEIAESLGFVKEEDEDES